MRTARINYGGRMGLSTRTTWYPERVERRIELRTYGGWKGDPLTRKPFFACGEARRRGWMVLAFENPYMRAIVRERFETALRARAVLPLP